MAHTSRRMQMRVLVVVCVLLAAACGGGSSVAMPDVRGLSIEEAQRMLDDLGLELDVTVAEADGDGDVGTVQGQQPAAGVALTAGAVVVLKAVVAAAEPGEDADAAQEEEEEPVEVVEVPDVTGMSVEEAEEALEAAGLKASRSGRGTDEADPDTVLEQNPSAGEELESGKRVRLIVAEAPKPGDVDQTFGTATVPEAPEGKVEVVAHAANVDRIRRLAFVVHNNTTRKIEGVSVAAIGRTSDGKMAASDSTNDVAPSLIAPGGRAVGYIYFSDEPAEGLQWEFTVTPGGSFFAEHQRNLTITEANTSGSSIVGAVVNDSGQSVRFAQVYYVCFGANGQPTTGNSAFTAPIDLQSGQPATFSDDHRSSCETYLLGATAQAG